MKVHHFARGFWEHEPASPTLACKRLRPLAPKLAAAATYDIKSFIRPESVPRKHGSSDYPRKESTHHQTEAPVGGTRWNPTQEQIGILEMLYRGGMRTPNAPQIEQITAQLGKYGKIEGKNVFYWFQNHKARERQKQKRNSLRATPSAFTTSNTATTCLVLSPVEEIDCNPQKRKSRSWGAFDRCSEEDRTLTLFPLHPEGRS